MQVIKRILLVLVIIILIMFWPFFWPIIRLVFVSAAIIGSTIMIMNMIEDFNNRPKKRKKWRSSRR